MTLIRNITGFKFNEKTDKLEKTKVMVHFTSDDIGETLSLQAGSFQITVPFNEIMKIVERERQKGYKERHNIIDETESGVIN